MSDTATEPNDTSMLEALKAWMGMAPESNRQRQLDQAEINEGIKAKSASPTTMTEEEIQAARTAELMEKYKN